MKNQRPDPGSGVSSSRLNISRAMRGRIPKIPIFPAIRNQCNEDQTALHGALILPPQSASSSALQQIATAAPADDRNHRSPSHYGFDDSSSDLTVTAPPKQPRRAGDVEIF